MSIFTMLILNREGSDRGKISAFQAGDGNWGAKEKPPLFIFATFEGELSHMQWAVKNCRYDFDKKVLVLNSDGSIFDPTTDVIENTPNFIPVNGYFGDRQLCLEILSEPTGDDCNDLKPSFVGTDNMRSYWINLWYPLRKMDGVVKLLETAYYGTYSDTRKVMQELTEKQRNDIFAQLGDKEVRYLKAICLAENPTEYSSYLTSGTLDEM